MLQVGSIHDSEILQASGIHPNANLPADVDSTSVAAQVRK